MRGQSAYVATMRLTRPPFALPAGVAGRELEPGGVERGEDGVRGRGRGEAGDGDRGRDRGGRGVKVGSGVVVPPQAAAAQARTAPTAMSRGDHMAWPRLVPRPRPRRASRFEIRIAGRMLAPGSHAAARTEVPVPPPAAISRDRARVSALATAWIEGTVIGSRTSWTVPIPSRGVRAECLGHRGGSPVSGGIAAWVASPDSRPVPPGSPTSTATVRSIAAGSRPTSRHASSTTSRSGAMPAGVLPMSAYHVFQASTYGSAIRSIRGPLEPMSSGGPPGRGAARQELAVAGLVVAPVEVDRALAQERPDDRERLLEAVHAVVVREAEGRGTRSRSSRRRGRG